MDSASVLSFFERILRIPRESGHEEPMTAFLQQFAAERSLECRTDKTGNVLIIKEAAPGKENLPAVVLQAHQDMVCDKLAGSKHDFLKDPIKYEIRDGWMVADETTLGADDGIGIAACLALLDSDLKTGKIECLFTISEETGMDGAFALEEGFFDGKLLLNLDSEDEGWIFIGCAGGIDTKAELKASFEAVRKGYKAVRLRIDGCIGGHSGDDINKERANALQQLARFLYTELQYEYQLISITGGNKANAIAREAEAVIAVPAAEFADTIEDFKAFGAILADEFKVSDPDIKVSTAEVSAPAKAISEEDTLSIVTTLVACPHGVIKMSQDIPGLVETSTNLASIRVAADGKVTIVTNQRSSSKSELHAAAQKVEAALLLGGFDAESSGEYPGWNPNVNSPLLKKCVASYKKLFGNEPVVKAIHAGLECGLFLEKFPDLDMVSFGPTLRGVHAPGEKLELASLDKFTDLLVDVVLNIGEKC